MMTLKGQNADFLRISGVAGGKTMEGLKI